MIATGFLLRELARGLLLPGTQSTNKEIPMKIRTQIKAGKKK